MNSTPRPLSTEEARSQLWKAVADNKPTHVANLLSSHPDLSDGQLPAESQPEDGSAPLGWYGRALTQIPLLNRPNEAKELMERTVETLRVLQEHGFEFKGVSEFADNVVVKKLLVTPNTPYSAWFMDNGLLTHKALLEFVLPPEPPRRRGPGL